MYRNLEELLSQALMVCTGGSSAKNIDFISANEEFQRELQEKYDQNQALIVHFGNEIGELALVPFRQGMVSNVNLVGPHEVLNFAHYITWFRELERSLAPKYFWDFGANVGLHSLVASRLGFNVTAFEPNPRVFNVLMENLSFNKVSSVTPVMAAIVKDNSTDYLEFIECVNNLTASSVRRSGKSIYGETNIFDVNCMSVSKLVDSVDLNTVCPVIKIDVEGLELEILEELINRLPTFRATIELSPGCDFSALLAMIYALKHRIQWWTDKHPSPIVSNIYDAAAFLPSSWREGNLYIKVNRTGLGVLTPQIA